MPRGVREVASRRWPAVVILDADGRIASITDGARRGANPTRGSMRSRAGRADGSWSTPHTVHDHIKAIFDKAGVNSRGELVGKLFSEHLLESMTENIAHPAVVTSG